MYFFKLDGLRQVLHHRLEFGVWERPGDLPRHLRGSGKVGRVDPGPPNVHQQL